MKLEDAIDFWVSETGFRQIQAYFSKRIHRGEIKYAQNNLLESTNDLTMAENAIETLKDAMRPGKGTDVYWRGDIEPMHTNHVREGFFAVTRDQKKAETYGTVYKVYVSKDVPRISFLKEGDETLLADGMVYEFNKEQNAIFVRPPVSANRLPYLGNLYKTRKARKNAEQQQLLERYIGNIYCYSFEIPEIPGIYEGYCEESILSDFNKLSILQRCKTLVQRLDTMPNKEEYLGELPFLLNTSEQTIKKVLRDVAELAKLSNGGRRRRLQRRTRRRRS